MDLAKPGTSRRRSGRTEVAHAVGLHRDAVEDVIDWLKDYHGIEIQLDNKALNDVGIGPTRR